MTQAQRFADEAIFVLQLNTRDAVRYIQRNAGCNETAATAAFRAAVVAQK
jgi:hypothetical protein